MKRSGSKAMRKCAAAAILVAGAVTHSHANADSAGTSPWGAADEIGTLNMMTDGSRYDALRRVAGGRVYDLGVDLFVGMPTCCAHFGDPGYQIWMTHAPERGRDKQHAAHSGDGVSMYTHTGTHIDTLNHFALGGRIWNGASAENALGVRGWRRSGAEKYPPIVARGVLIDVARHKKAVRLPASYGITAEDLQAALREQHTRLRPGDVVLIRTGLMTLWPEASQYRLADQAGLRLDAARWLVETQKAMLVGADNFGVESFPSSEPGNFAPVHTYLLAERGVSLLEVLWLEELAKDQVYEFLFVAAPLKMRGATGSPVRPVAFPLRSDR